MPKTKNNALHDAVEAGNLAEVQAQVSNFDINAYGQYDEPALCKAIRYIEVVKLLLTFNADVNIPDWKGDSVLIRAVENCRFEIVQELLKVHGINVNHANRNGQSALLLAVGSKRDLANIDFRNDIVYALLEVHDINVNQAGNDGNSVLIQATCYVDTKIVQDLLKLHDINVNHANNDGTTALIVAAEGGRTEIVKGLLEFHYININQVDSKGNSALLLAVANFHTEIVKDLLTIHDINGNQVNSDGNSALILAVRGRTDIVQELLKIHDINVNQVNSDGNSALILAVARGRTDIVQELLKIHNINVNHASNDGNSALTLAATGGHNEMVQDLLKVHDICVNHANNDGNSALTLAATGGHNEMVKELLKVHGINLNHANKEGSTSMHCAAQRTTIEIKYPQPNNAKSKDILIALLSHGADVRIKNKQGMTCFGLLKSAMDKLAILTKIDLNLSNCKANNCALWFVIVQEDGTSDVDLYTKLLAKVEALVTTHPILATAKDADGRAAVDVASKPMKSIMHSVLLWHGRYRITESRPEHISATCFVFKAVDEDTIDGETNQPTKVALKLMRLKDQFQREISIREKGFNNQMVMNVLQHMRPNSLLKTSQVDKGRVYHLSQMGVYTKQQSYYRCVEKALVETVYRLRSEDPTKLVYRAVCSKHEHDLSLNPFTANLKCNFCSALNPRAFNPRYTCPSICCKFNICEECFNKDGGQEFPAETTMWLLTMQEGKDQSETELARSDAPTIRVSDAVFTNIKVSEGENGTMVVIDVQEAVTVSPNVTQDNEPDLVVDADVDATGQLTKTNAEKFYLLVMPLAERNLFVALKQERWAGKIMEEVRHVFVQLVHCVDHMHENGVLHGDLKTLNIVRTAGQWKLIDLDAACVIGKEPVGHKSSSAYVPPEAIYIDEKTDTAFVRSVVAVTKGEANYELLTAHPSFDVWSLGCILYQMCTVDVKPLFQGGQDDNLVGVRKGVDNLFALSEWSPELKADKLADVPDKLARNLLSQMLHKDPLQRPSLSRVLAHSFLSGKKVARLVGEKPKYDVFLSYRVAADAHHVEKLYNLLTAQGFKVYWDKLCLEPGVDWEQGFCEGLVSSRAFVPLLSRHAINHPDKAWQNFSKLAADSKCDNVFLEHRLAVELQGLGLIEKIFPVFIGNLDATTLEYSNYFGSSCHPSLSEVTVKSVEEKLRHHMESQALGTPVVPDRTVASVVGAITACQGAFIVGPADATFADAVTSIVKMLTDVPMTQSPRSGSHVHQALRDTTDVKTLVAEVSALKGEVGILKIQNDTLIDKVENLESKIDSLEAQRKAVLASLRSGAFVSVDAVIAQMEALLQE